MRATGIFISLLILTFITAMLDPQFDWSKFTVGAITGLVGVLVIAVGLAGLTLFGSGLNPASTKLIIAIALLSVLVFGAEIKIPPVNVPGVPTINLTLGANLFASVNNIMGQIPILGTYVVVLWVLMLYITMILAVMVVT